MTTRKERYAPKTADGRPSAFSARLYSRFRRAWFSSKDVDLALYAGYQSQQGPGADLDRFGADPVGISVKFYNRTTWLSLHNFTEDELLGMKAFFNAAFDTAIPVARAMDAVARAEYDSGATEVSSRLFRLSPILVIRDRDAPLKLAELPAPPDNIKEISNGHQSNGSGEATP